MTVFNRIFLISAFVIAVADVALASETSSPAMVIGSMALARLDGGLRLRRVRRTRSSGEDDAFGEIAGPTAWLAGSIDRHTTAR